MVKFIIAFNFKPDFVTAMYSTFAVSFYTSWFFNFSGGCTDLYKKNEKVPKCSSFKTDSRVRKQLILKNKILFCYLPAHFFNQVTCWLSPSGVTSIQIFAEGFCSRTVSLVIILQELAYMSITGGPWAAQRTTSGMNPDHCIWGPKFCRWHYH